MTATPPRRWIVHLAWAAALLAAPVSVELAADFRPSLLPRTLQIFNARRAVWRDLTAPDAELGYVLKAPLARALNWGDFRRLYRHDVCAGGFGYRTAGGGDVRASDILALGSSQTYGLDVNAEDVWVSRLSALSGRSAANLGVLGYTTSQSLGAVERCPPVRPPKLVVVLLAADPAAEALFASWRKESAAGTLPAWQAANFNSYVFARVVPLNLPAYKAVKTLMRRSLLFNITFSMALAVRDESYARRVMAEGTALMSANLLELRRRFPADKTGLLVVFVPAWRRIDSLDAVRGLRADLAGAGIATLDLAPMLGRLSDGRHSLALDHHWTELGNDAVAQEILRYAREKRLLD